MDEEMDLQDSPVGELGLDEEDFGLTDEIAERDGIEVFASEADQFEDAIPIAIMWDDGSEMQLEGSVDDEEQQTETRDALQDSIETLNQNIVDSASLLTALIACLIGFLSAAEALKIWLQS